MRRRFLFALAVACVTWAPMATAQNAVITRAVTVRAGPDRFFPPATSLLSGTAVTVVGCVESWRWCDIIAGRDRGWVYSRYLAYASGGNKITILDGGPGLGLPSIEFSLGAYWDEHYVGRPWAGNRVYWQNRWERRPPPQPWRPPARVNAK
jgi:uncharacterized protein YraI